MFTLRTAENSATIWRPIASIVGFVFFLRWCGELCEACRRQYNNDDAAHHPYYDNNDNEENEIDGGNKDNDIESLALMENAKDTGIQNRKDPDALHASTPTVLAETSTSDSTEEKKQPEQIELIKTA